MIGCDGHDGRGVQRRGVAGSPNRDNGGLRLHGPLMDQPFSRNTEELMVKPVCRTS